MLLSLLVVSSAALSEETGRYIEHGFIKIDCWEIKSAIFMYASGAVEARKTAIDTIRKSDQSAFSAANNEAKSYIKEASYWSTVYNAICEK